LTFSIRTSLAASTVTPGIAAPDVSFTTPTIALCAYAALDTKTAPANATSVLEIFRDMLSPFNDKPGRGLSRPGQIQSPATT
jgi:hypothetical protein